MLGVAHPRECGYSQHQPNPELARHVAPFVGVVIEHTIEARALYALTGVSRTPNPPTVSDAQPPDTLSLQELLSAVEARGYPPTARLIKRYRTEGLLRCLGQEHPAGTRGSSSRYAPSAIDQVALVTKLGTVDRRFDQRRILVAWHGGWVEPTALRASLEKALDRVSKKVRDAIAGIDDPGDAADLLLRQEREDASPASTKLLRQRLGGSWRQLQSVMFAFAVMALGGEIDWQDHDPASTEEPLEGVMERATAVDRVRAEPLINGRALLPEADNAKQTITDLVAAGMFDMRDLASPLRSADSEMIARGFQDVHTIADMALFAEAVEASRGPDAGGLGGARLFASDALDAFTLALLVRATLIIRKAVPDAALDETAAALNAARGPLTVFLELRRAMPQHADAIGLDYGKRIAQLPADQAAHIQRDVKAFLDSRPDLTTMLTSSRS